MSVRERPDEEKQKMEGEEEAKASSMERPEGSRTTVDHVGDEAFSSHPELSRRSRGHPSITAPAVATPPTTSSSSSHSSSSLPWSGEYYMQGFHSLFISILLVSIGLLMLVALATLQRDKEVPQTHGNIRHRAPIATIYQQLTASTTSPLPATAVKEVSDGGGQQRAAQELCKESPPKPRPQAFDGCGTWQEDYMDLHRRILTGELPPKYLVAITVEAGLSDRLVGIISEFYIALLSGRAFQITSAHQKLPQFEAAFDAPFINWTRADDPKEMIEHLFSTYKGQRGYTGPREFPETVDTSKYWSSYLINSAEANTFYATDDLSQYPDGHGDVETLFVTSNRGRTFDLFDNPYHRQQLYDMGLRPETAFGCAFRFLFAPNDAVKEAFSTEFERLQTKPDTIRIGINVRVGDWAFNPEEDKAHVRDLEFYRAFFDCVNQIEEFSRTPKRTNVLWYVTSDSNQFRKLTQEKYGSDKVVTHLGQYFHGDCQQFHQTCNKSAEDMSIIMASGQIWAMAMTDYQVITRESGFGRMGAFLSMKWHSIYSKGIIEGRWCRRDDYDKVEAISRDWAGI